ncbi:MAG: bifunctional aspartate transaminase/aspartate 4-decarboxylase [Gammaproteobacteria bacterium]|nr:bifunctional aspartate transaminase/aspartate 4-decarboxylase [Gammaproteobacteria bacterium]
MKPSEEKRYETLSPFELKNKLIQISTSTSERIMLNAGRGNPNWLALEPRNAFFLFGHFAMEEAALDPIRPGFGKSPKKDGSWQRFQSFLTKNSKNSGAETLHKIFSYVENELKYPMDEFIYEMVDAICGDHYPEPDRMLNYSEKIVQKYLKQEMCANESLPATLDLFATEGGTAAMDYIFNSLMENKLLHKGDKIALGTPIFTPYLEIPLLNDFEFVEINISQDENSNWQYPESEIEKLSDPSIKAFFLVNPSNPTSVSMQQSSLDKIAELIKTKRPDLILLTDDVYGTFVNGFKSLIDIAPHNTILVYSFSKYFGATGWRLGVIGICEQNIFDDKIAQLPEKDRAELHKRYSTTTIDPDKMKFIDRLVADSRLVALHHTAGLSTPQQVMMVFFALFCLIDKQNSYKQNAQAIVTKRHEMLYKALGVTLPDNEQICAHYYATIDVPKLAHERHGEEFAKYLVEQFEPIDFVVRLAEEKSIVLMDGGGFDAPNMSVRVSLANLSDEAYVTIGQGISELLEEYYQNWKLRK